jgi:hypothetical protein
MLILFSDPKAGVIPIAMAATPVIALFNFLFNFAKDLDAGHIIHAFKIHL